MQCGCIVPSESRQVPFLSAEAVSTGITAADEATRSAKGNGSGWIAHFPHTSVSVMSILSILSLLYEMCISCVVCVVRMRFRMGICRAAKRRQCYECDWLPIGCIG